MPYTPVVLPIDEAERAAEHLLGPYTAEEHAKWGQVVGEHRLNRAYTDPSVQPADRLDPDAGKRKRVRGPDELETPGPIRAVPLRAVGAGGSGALVEEASGSLAKRLAPAPGTARETGSPSASCVAELVAVDARAGVAARSFGVASFAPEEVSGGTPSQVYGRGTEDTRVEDRPPLPEPAGYFCFRCCCLLCFCRGFVDSCLCCAAVVAEGGRGGAPASGDGVSSGPSGAEERAVVSGAVESLGAGGSRGGSGAEEDGLAADSSRAAPVTANVGALCALDFKISDGVASVCEEVGGFAAPPYLNVLFDRVPVDRMFRTIEANAVKVSYFTCFCAFVAVVTLPFLSRP